MDRIVLKECLKEKERNIRRRRDCKESKEYLRRQQGIVKLRREDTDIVLELKTRHKQVQEREQFNKIRNTKYNRMYKFIGKKRSAGVSGR